MLKILIAPSHYIIDPNYGTEYAWAYHIISGLSKYYEITAYTGKANCVIKGVKFIESKFYKKGLLNNLILPFKLYWEFKDKIKEYDALHYMFTLTPNAGYSLLSFKAKKLILGPILYPSVALTSTKPNIISDKMLKYLKKITFNLTDYFKLMTRMKADGLVFDSYKTFNLFKDIYKINYKDKIIKVIPFPIETDIFKYKEFRKKEKINILSVSRLVYGKRIEVLIAAMSKVIKEFKNSNLIIANDGPMLPYLKKLVKKLELEKFVQFIGRVPRYKLVKVYHSSDIYVQPSQIGGGFSFAILEAMSCGLPIIAANVGFMDEYLKHGVNGLLLRKADSEEISEAIIKLISDDELRFKMGLENRKLAEEKFSVDKVQNEWIKFYADVLSS